MDGSTEFFCLSSAGGRSNSDSGETNDRDYIGSHNGMFLLTSLRTLIRLSLVVLCIGERFSVTAQQVDWAATFTNIGVEVTLATATPADSVVQVSYREAIPNAQFRLGHPLSRRSETQFSGSVFGLNSGKVYTIRLSSTLFQSDQEFTAHTRHDHFPSSQGAIFHVSPDSGSDSNSGTSLAQAFGTLGRAILAVQAGNKIILHDGTYFEGDLFVNRSGTAQAPIVIENAEGASPVINGIDIGFTPQWELFDAANHLYRTPCLLQPDKGYLDGAHFFRYLDLDDLRVLRWSQPGGFFVNGSHLYARFPQNGIPSSHVLTLPRFTTAMTFDQQSHWQIRGLTFQHFGFGAFHRGIYIDGGDDILIDACHFRHNVVGVGIKRAANRNVIQDCTFSDSPLSTWNWHAVKSGGVAYEGGGVVVYSSNVPNVGNVIRRCQFSDTFDGAHLLSSNLDGPTRDMDFHGNHVENCLDDALELDGAGVNVRIFDNRFQSFLTGVSAAPAFLGPSYVYRNIFHDWDSVAEFTGYPFKFNVNTAFQTQFVYLYHNTCYTANPGQDGFLFKNYSNWQHIVSRNNIYSGSEYAFESQSQTNPIDFNFDNLFTSHPTRFARWLGSDYATLDAFRQASGQEQLGFFVDPKFVDAAAADFSLESGSLLIDAGIRIPGLNDVFSGAGPDIGALER